MTSRTVSSADEGHLDSPAASTLLAPFKRSRVRVSIAGRRSLWRDERWCVYAVAFGSTESGTPRIASNSSLSTPSTTSSS
jgi:hypothetical protein